MLTRKVDLLLRSAFLSPLFTFALTVMNLYIYVYMKSRYFDVVIIKGQNFVENPSQALWSLVKTRHKPWL